MSYLGVISGLIINAFDLGVGGSSATDSTTAVSAGAPANPLYLKTAGGNSNAAGTWSATGPNGVDNAGPPAASNNLILDSTSGQLTINAALACRSVNCTSGPNGSYTNTITHNAATTWSIGDATSSTNDAALVFSSGMTYTLGNATTSAISFVSTATTQQEILTAGKTLGNITINGTGSSWLQVGDLTSSGSFTRTAGTYHVNGFTITLNGATATFAGGSASWDGTVALTGSGVATISGANTFVNLTRTGTALKTDALTMTSGQTVMSTLTLTGNSVTNRLLVQSNTIGSSRTLTAAVASLTNIDCIDITGAGAASPFTGTSLGNGLGNSGITFDSPATQTHTASAGGNWSDVTKWTSRVPLPQDNVVVDVNTTGTLTADMPRLGANVTFTGFAATYTSSISNTLYGSIVFASGMSMPTTGLLTLAGRSALVVTSAGKTYAGTGFRLNAPGATYTQTDAFNCNGTSGHVLNNGNWNTGGFTFTSQLVSLGSGCGFTCGASTINLTATSGTPWLGSSGNVSAASATFVIASVSSSSRVFGGGSFTYGTLTYTVAGSTGGLSIQNSSTFGTINFSDVTNARTLTFSSGQTTTITSTFNVNGTSGKLMSIVSSSAGSAANLVKTSGSVACTFLSIKDSAASGGASFAATSSTDVSGNSGWVITP